MASGLSKEKEIRKNTHGGNMKLILMVIMLVLFGCTNQPIDNNADGLVPAVKEV